MISNNPYTLYGSKLKDVLNEYLETGINRDLSVESFFTDRVKIKSIHHTIVPFVPKKIQLIHQQAKQDALKAGKKARFLLLKSRRMGMTTWEQALSYKAVATMPNTTCVTLADNQSNTKSIFRMVNLMAQLDPRLKYKTNESKIALEIPAINTYFHIGTAGSRSFSRGNNVYRAHGSEVAWWAGDYDLIGNLMAGISEATRYGEVILETTANGASGWFYEEYKEAMAGKNQWVPLFYPWFTDPQNTLVTTKEKEQEWLDTVTGEEKELMSHHNLSIHQMLWRRDKQGELKKLFQQEYPESWTQAFLTRSNTFFDQSLLSELATTLKAPINHRDYLTVWQRPIQGHKYILGADTAEGVVGGDNSVAGILNKTTGEQVAVLRGKWRPEVFARKCIELCKEYNNALFTCEINNHGHSVMNTVMNVLMYKHIYYRTKILEKDKYGNGKVEKVPGWKTDSATRPILLDELNEALENKFMIVNDSVFLAECKSFIDTGERYEADSGKKDDSIVAWGIAWQGRKAKTLTYKI